MLRTPLALLVSICFAGGTVACQTDSALRASSSANPPSVRAAETKAKHESKAALPACPPAGIMAAEPPASGHHTVLLRWNPSLPTPKVPDPIAGYCLYRSTTDQPTLQKKPTCPKCQQVNAIPIAGTSCVDDLVADQTTYYYVVTAINTHGIPSLPSNEVTVATNDDKQAGPPADGTPPPPVCRLFAPAK